MPSFEQCYTMCAFGRRAPARRLNRNSGQICPRPRPHRGRASFANGRNFPEVGLHQCPSERKGEGAPVRSLRVPSHVPSHPQTAAKVRGFSPIGSGFTAETDWLLEESGFEPSVPLGEKRSFRNASIRELHRAAYRGGRKRYRRRRPSGSRRSDHSNTAMASELQVRPVG